MYQTKTQTRDEKKEHHDSDSWSWWRKLTGDDHRHHHHVAQLSSFDIRLSKCCTHRSTYSWNCAFRTTSFSNLRILRGFDRAWATWRRDWFWRRCWTMNKLTSITRLSDMSRYLDYSKGTRSVLTSISDSRFQIFLSPHRRDPERFDHKVGSKRTRWRRYGNTVISVDIYVKVRRELEYQGSNIKDSMENNRREGTWVAWNPGGDFVALKVVLWISFHSFIHWSWRCSCWLP